MMQGDAYSIPLEIKMNDKPIDGNDVEDIEVFIENLRKLMSENSIVYDPEGKHFLVKFSQKETFLFSPGNKPVQVRIKFKNGDVIGVQAGEINVLDATSQVVI